MYDLAALNAELVGTLFAGKLHFARVTGSTNADAITAARDGAPHGSVFLADEQMAGRGRGNHGWISAAGKGLYVSVLFRPQIPPARLPLLPLAAGLAAAESIRAASGLSVDLRWPNDLLIGPRKTGGILLESKPESKGPPHAVVVVGIGINVHQRVLSSKFATPATSLDLEAEVAQRGGDRSLSLGWKADRRISRQTLLVALLKSLEREASALADQAAAQRFPPAWSRLPRGFGAAASKCTARSPARASRAVSTNTVSCA